MAAIVELAIRAESATLLLAVVIEAAVLACAGCERRGALQDLETLDRRVQRALRLLREVDDAAYARMQARRLLRNARRLLRMAGRLRARVPPSDAARLATYAAAARAAVVACVRAVV